MKKQILLLLERVLKEMGQEGIVPQVSVPENPDHGDFSTNIALKMENPRKFAEDLKNTIQKHQTTSGAGIIDRVEVAGPGFLNLYLSEAIISSQIGEVLKNGNAYGHVTNREKKQETSGVEQAFEAKKIEQKNGVNEAGKFDLEKTVKIEKKAPIKHRKNAAIDDLARQNDLNKKSSPVDFISAKRIIIEFADPNPFKEIHIGHVRNITLGESFCRLLESQGNIVRRANYEGDIGLHVAKALYGKMHGAEWQVAYAAGSKAFEESEDVKKEIGELNKRLYAQDPTLMELYQEGRSWSLNEFEAVYRRLGTHFDRYYFESEVAPVGVSIVKEHPDVFEVSDGAIVYRGEKVGLHTRVFITKEQYATYEAKDLALAPLKYAEWPYDLSIIMTGNEQSEYFKVMLAALSEINSDLAARTQHIPFGMVNLKTGKMSSRTGDVITAAWLIEEAKKKIQGIISANASNYTESEQNDISEKAAIAAIKYSMLRVNSISDIAFDIEASVSFEGDSGPYLQYTYARAKSVLRKVNADSRLRGNDNMNSDERTLARAIIQFPDIVAESAQNLAPNSLCTYLFHLAQQFNLFYAKNPIIGDQKRLDLTAATAQVLKNGLYLLGIETMERM